MGNSVFSTSQGGEGSLEVGLLISLVDDSSFMVSREQHPPEAGSVNPDRNFWCAVLSQQLNGWREAAIQDPVVPIDVGHPAQPTVM